MSDFITVAELRIEAERLCDENERLEADNAKLREEFNKMDVWHSKELTAAMAENAKLRELCSDIWHLFTEHGAVHPCDLPVVDAVRDRMRELGVEVDA